MGCGYCVGIEDKYRVKPPVKIPVSDLDIDSRFWGTTQLSFYIQNGYLDVTVNHGVTGGSIHKAVKIYYCPMCGKALKHPEPIIEEEDDDDVYELDKY